MKDNQTTAAPAARLKTVVSDMPELKIPRSVSIRQAAAQVLTLGLVVASALMIWKLLICFTNTESPVVVVLSESMAPAIDRGDILFLRDVRSADVPIDVGDIVVFKLPGRDIPIVHRVISSAADGRVLTKGDNNLFDDRGLYPQGQMWIRREDLIGKAAGVVPHVGMLTIIMNEYPKLRLVLLGGLGILVLLGKD